VDELIKDFITNTVNDLTNYYLKSETYTQTEVNQLIAAIKQFRYLVANSLPTASADTMGIIYLVPSSNPETRNVKDEYITLSVDEGSGIVYYWEQIGSTTVDLSGYYTSAQTDTAITTAINTALADYSTTSQMTAAIATAIANYYTKAEVDALIANFITASVNNLVNYYLKTDTYTKAEVQQLIDAVKQFTYQSVSTLPTASADTMNKIYLVPSTNPETRNVKDEFITIAVTDQGTTTYSWEQIGSTTIDLSGYYTSAQTDTAISNALAAYSTTEQMNTAITTAINTALADYSTTSQMTAAIATAIANYYTKAEVDALIANFITASVNNLVNYYLKTDTYTKAEVQQLIAAIQQFQYVSVTTLPTASADTMNKIYLVPSTNPGTQNVKDEYITIAVTDQGTTTYSWEVIGSTDIDLANYYTKQQTDGAITHALNTALADYTTTANLTTLLQGKQDTLTFDDAPTENSNNPVKSGGIYSALTGKEPVITNMAKKGFGKGTCSTAAATQAKTVTISNFLLLTNCIVTVYFQNAVGVTEATLNVSDTGAKPIMINGVTPQPGVIPPKSTVMLQYDGTNWNVISIQQLDLSFSPDYLFVDMGLPSGLMWAKRNIDVTQPNGFAASEFQYECSFFSWGNVECHNPISDSAFDYDFGSSNEGPYASTPGAALTGDASLSYDAARINCGAPWRLPTTDEFAELFNNIDYIDANGDVIDPSQTNKLVTVNGIVGIFLKSKVNGNRLFFPCSGYGNGTSWINRGSNGNYWSSSLYSATDGRYLYFYSYGNFPQNSYGRFNGIAGRAVQ
jgi:urease accessory protein UreF